MASIRRCSPESPLRLGAVGVYFGPAGKKNLFNINKLERHRPQIAFSHTDCKNWRANKPSMLMLLQQQRGHTGLLHASMQGDKAAAVAKSSSGDTLGRQGGSGSQEQPKAEIKKEANLRDKAAAVDQNGNQEGRRAWETMWR